jgi:hypothetical protein
MQFQRDKEEIFCLLCRGYGKTPCRHSGIVRLRSVQQNLLQFLQIKARLLRLPERIIPLYLSQL